jgi:hypothetical protein
MFTSPKAFPVEGDRKLEKSKMEDQLNELVNLQREQNQLLKKYLWRLRFSLLSLLLLTTASAAILEFMVYQDRSKVNQPGSATTTISGFWSPTPSPSQGTLSSGVFDNQIESPRYDLIKRD